MTDLGAQVRTGGVYCGRCGVRLTPLVQLGYRVVLWRGLGGGTRCRTAPTQLHRPPDTAPTPKGA